MDPFFADILHWFTFGAAFAISNGLFKSFFPGE